MEFSLLLTCFLLLTPFLCSQGAEEPLTVRECGKLPSSRYNLAAAYDGQDSIFILGGTTAVGAGNGQARPLKDIVQYDLKSGTSKVVAQFSTPVASGQAVWANNQIYYFGPTYEEDGSMGGVIWTLSTSNPTPNKVGALAKAHEHGSVVTDNAGYIYIIGGLDKASDSTLADIERYEISSGKIKKLGELPFPSFDTVAVYSDPVIEVLGGGLANGDSYPGGFVPSNRVVRIQHHENGTTDVKRMDPLPYFMHGGSAVLVQSDLAYVIGGNWGALDGGSVSNGVLRYNVGQNKGIAQPLSPSWSTPYAHASVYVEKGDSGIIYTFGGITESHETDKVMCIQVKGGSGSGGSSSGWSLKNSVSLILVSVIYNKFFS